MLQRLTIRQPSRHYQVENETNNLSRVGLLLQNYEPGLPMTTAVMERLGINGDSITRFVQNGYLKRLGRGAYCLPKDRITAAGTAVVLMREYPDLHVGGRTALDWQGVRHNVSVRLSVRLYGTRRIKLPTWTDGFEVQYHRVPELFDFESEEGRRLDQETLCFVPVGALNLWCSVPERAFLEYLNDVCQKKDGSAEEAMNLLDSLVCPRPEVLGPMLRRCRSVQVKRLFCQLARRAAFLGFDLAEFVAVNDVYLGSSPLSLKPIERDREASESRRV